MWQSGSAGGGKGRGEGSGTEMVGHNCHCREGERGEREEVVVSGHTWPESAARGAAMATMGREVRWRALARSLEKLV